MAQAGVPVDMLELVSWVGEAYDIDDERFKPKNAPMQGQMQGQMQKIQPPQIQPPQTSVTKTKNRSMGQVKSPAKQMASSMGVMAQ